MTHQPPTALPWRTSMTDSTTIIGPDREGVATMLGDYDADDEWPFMEANAALIVRAVNERAGLIDALNQAEACMTIVEPRSDKAEYLRILGVVRDALSRAKEPQA